ncbi:hypothetical protein I3843_12G103600 [Carya illinoinensis]|uniref:Uncharacterized protein n=1 Tax=Carya illinoinensis TaxID=32201 RepID=A0A8T1NV07_CARIL|nr:uncharacterized protein LOC122289449 [Carya illinoinensis]KAG2677526.1 hypothetical protein I3760_12G101700 [Carya illinoinensis]KAG6634245.1 hypothetical protein CIPAW_12G104900 [Carya illinoinensis]KAG7953318.1 hypothetical protein I3843_12G103600 [Carya illinoinensis]
MKLVWSPETASKAYIDTVKSCDLYHESGVAELVSAMAAGWNANFIVETWSQGGVLATSIGLAVASRHTGGRHVCIVQNEQSRTEYAEGMVKAGMSPEVMVGEPEEVMDQIVGIDFLVVDCKRKDFARILRLAKLSSRGAVLVCKNASSKSASTFKWRSVLDGGSRRLVRCVFLPVGMGLDIAHVATSGGNSGSGTKRWIKHVDQQSGEEYVIRT